MTTTGLVVYLTPGEDEGVKIGDIFEVYEEGGTLRDRMDKERVVEPDKPIALIKILKVGPFASTGVIEQVEALVKLEKGDKLRLVKRLTE